MTDDEVTVAALAARVEQSQLRLAQVTARLDHLQNAVAAAADLADAIDALAQRVDQLGEQLSANAADSELADFVPVAWLDVPPERAPDLLAELAEWTATVLAPYRVAGTLLPCWYRHPAVVQVLLDARLAWLAAYRNPAGGRVLAALDWSQRHLPHLESRVRELLGRCSTVRHADPEPTIPLADPGLRGYARWWASRRDSGEATPAPPPVRDTMDH